MFSLLFYLYKALFKDCIIIFKSVLVELLLSSCYRYNLEVIRKDKKTRFASLKKTENRKLLQDRRKIKLKLILNVQNAARGILYLNWSDVCEKDLG